MISTDGEMGVRILTPDQRLRVFVSSTLQELAPERAAARTAIESLQLIPVLFETGARPYPPQELYRAYLGQSDIFVGIYWQSYGWMGPGMEISGLEDEFRQSEGIPRLVYVKAPAPDREPRLTEFLDGMRDSADVSYKRFSMTAELGQLVKDDLALLLTERFFTERFAPARQGSGRPEPLQDVVEPRPPPREQEVSPPELPTVTSAVVPGPSIAVLPFSNFSGDAGHDYFVDGMVDGIITALSRFKWLTVLARNSTFAYRGRADDIRRIGKELGARYVLEGSVQTVGERVRIQGQLIDASTGAHVWAERFDGTMEDIFDLEDRVTERVVSVLEPQLRKAEIERARRKRPDNMDAYDLYMRSLPHAYAMRPEDNASALLYLEEAMRLDPGFIPARAFAAWCYEERLTRGWPSTRDDDAERAVQLAQDALSANTDDAHVIAIAGFVLLMVGRRYDTGLEALRHAVELTPFNAFVLMNAGWAEAFAGDVGTALEYLRRARLNPRDPAAFYVLTGLAMVNILLGRYEEAREFAARSAAVYDGWDATYLMLGIASARSGRPDEARAAISRLAELWPGISISHYRKAIPVRDPDRLVALERDMRAAGVPED
jgi:TolB-like protein/Tfp pilus assembly protein PilF